MNWYKFSHEKFSQEVSDFLGNISLSDLSGLGWMDPAGNVYSVFPHSVHSVWAIENKDILEEYYRIKIKDKIDANQKLIQDGWIRIRNGNNNYFIFEVNSFDNKILLKNIEEELFFAANLQSDISICDFKSKKCSNFKWGDFVNYHLT